MDVLGGYNKELESTTLLKMRKAALSSGLGIARHRHHHHHGSEYLPTQP